MAPHLVSRYSPAPRSSAHSTRHDSQVGGFLVNLFFSPPQLIRWRYIFRLGGVVLKPLSHLSQRHPRTTNRQQDN